MLRVAIFRGALKVFTLDRRLVLRRIGRLGTKDKKAVRGAAETRLL
jgi:hypothetical protein